MQSLQVVGMEKSEVAAQAEAQRTCMGIVVGGRATDSGLDK